MRLLVLGGSSERAVTLARTFTADGHAVRAVTRDEAHRARIEAAGAECWIGDPNVVGTLRYALDNVTLVLHLLGGAGGEGSAEAGVGGDLHGTRLEMLLERTIDTTVRGIVYEEGPHNAAGRATLERIATFNEIPHRIVRRDDPAWQDTIRTHVDELLAGTRRLPRVV